MFTLQLSIESSRDPDRRHLQPARRCAGAIFLVMIDPFLTYLKDDLPGIIAGLAATFGADSVTAGRFIARRPPFDPPTASGRDLRGDHRAVRAVPSARSLRALAEDKTFFQLFPLYKRATFKRQKIYVKRSGTDELFPCGKTCLCISGPEGG